VLTRIDANAWRLELHPAQRTVGEPGRGRAFRGMANRYVNCLKEPPVSILLEDRLEFHLLAFKAVAVRELGSGTAYSMTANGSFVLPPGIYDLITA
jgi:hypothetical protein